MYELTGIFAGLAGICGPILIKLIIPKSEKEIKLKMIQELEIIFIYILLVVLYVFLNLLF